MGAYLFFEIWKCVQKEQLIPAKKMPKVKTVITFGIVVLHIVC
jgi:hypothetical protein